MNTKGFSEDFYHMGDMEKDGERIAKKYRWNVDDIVNVFAVALEDANAHTFRSKMVELWKAECKQLDEMPNPFTNERKQTND